jgi:hypothetical protein
MAGLANSHFGCYVFRGSDRLPAPTVVAARTQGMLGIRMKTSSSHVQALRDENGSKDPLAKGTEDGRVASPSSRWTSTPWRLNPEEPSKTARTLWEDSFTQRSFNWWACQGAKLGYKYM